MILNHYTQVKNIMINLSYAPSGFYPQDWRLINRIVPDWLRKKAPAVAGAFLLEEIADGRWILI